MEKEKSRTESEELFEMECSNCGKKSGYTQEELDEAFPFSREKLFCKKGDHHLSTNGWFIGV